MDTTFTFGLLLRTARPRYWPRAGITALAALCAPGRPATSRLVSSTASAVLASAAVYLHNDVCDRDRDRLHPDKRQRPVAAGVLEPRTALLAAGAAGVAGLVVAGRGGSRNVLAIGSYLAGNVAYSRGAKRVPALEMLLVALGVPLRLEAGNPGPGRHPWTAAALPAALATVAAKRTAELTRGRTDRVVLRHYHRRDLVAFGALNAFVAGHLAARRCRWSRFPVTAALLVATAAGCLGRSENLVWVPRTLGTSAQHPAASQT